MQVISDYSCDFPEVVGWKVMSEIYWLNLSNFSRTSYELEDFPLTDLITVSGTKQDCKNDCHWLMNIPHMLFSKFQHEVAHKFSWLGSSTVIWDE